MSTIVVVRKAGQAVIAADSLSKWGAAKEPAAYIVNYSKISQVGESFLGAAGHGSGNLMMEDYFSSLREEVRLDNAADIFRAWVKLHEALKEHYHIRPEEDEDDAVESSRMDVLIANPGGIFGVSADRTVQEYSRFYAFGSGREYAMGAMFAVYEDPARSAEEIARLAIEAAAEFDDGTALPLTLHTVALRN